MTEEKDKQLNNPAEEKAAFGEGEPRPEDSGRETKEFLARGEIRTMQKDVSKLQETEAKEERNRIAGLKTEEEERREKEKEERARREAAERGKAEMEARKKEEELVESKEERKKEAEVMAKEKLERKELRAEEFKEKEQEVQTEEEKERRRFLERVEAKAEGKETPLSPLPPIIQKPPAPPKVPAEPAAQYGPYRVLPKKPSFFDKLWIRVVVSLLVLAILGGMATFWYWYFVVREAPAEKIGGEMEKSEQPEEIIVPPALIPVENSETFEIDNLAEVSGVISQVLSRNLGENQFTRIIIENVPENKIIGLSDFLAAFGVEAAPGFYEKINDDFTLFVYSARGINRLGFAAEIKEAGLNDLIKSWEPTMENDLANLLLFLGKSGPAAVPYFRQTAYQNAVFRYLSLPPENFGVCWAIVGNYFIFTFSGESMIKTIDKIGLKR